MTKLSYFIQQNVINKLIDRNKPIHQYLLFWTKIKIYSPKTKKQLHLALMKYSTNIISRKYSYYFTSSKYILLL